MRHIQSWVVCCLVWENILPVEKRIIVSRAHNWVQRAEPSARFSFDASPLPPLCSLPLFTQDSTDGVLCAHGQKNAAFAWRHEWPGPCCALLGGWDAATAEAQNDLATLAGCLPSQHPHKPAECAPSFVPRAPLPLRTAVNKLSATMWQSQGRRATPGGGGAKAPKATSRHCRERPESPRCRLSHDHLAAAAFRFPLSSPSDAAELLR